MNDNIASENTLAQQKKKVYKIGDKITSINHGYFCSNLENLKEYSNIDLTRVTHGNQLLELTVTGIKTATVTLD